MAYTTIDKPTDHFKILTYTGNATDGRAVTGVGFQPDLNIIKSRGTTDKWFWQDSIRGASNEINSEDTQDEQNKTDGVQSFDSDGFTVGTRAVVNGSGYNLCSWNWLAASSNTTDTSGTVSCTRRSNATAGFAMLQYNADQSSYYTLGHGLSSAPELVIARARVGANAWGVYYTVRGVNTNWARLNTVEAQGSNNGDPDAQGRASGASGYIGNFIETTSSVVYVNNSAFASDGTGNNIMYLFHSVKGYSKIGKYAGNNSTNGTFVYLGFRPAFLMIKRIDNNGAWLIYDSARYPENKATGPNKLYWNEAGSEDSSTDPSGDTASTNMIDLLSNGFKLRSDNTYSNGNAEDYIYYAVAENPFVSSGGVPATAR